MTQLPPRSFKPVNFSKLPYEISEESRFTIFSFNILSDRYCTASLYPYCPKWARSWEYRKKVILDQIENANADIVALQEVILTIDVI